MDVPDASETPAGLEVVLDKLEYLPGAGRTPPETPHVFVYHLTIRNGSDRTVTLLARKWIVQDAAGDVRVIEGDKIVGETPRLEPGQAFSYNSFHLSAGDAVATGSFHGHDEGGTRIHVRIPRFVMRVPKE
jgi:ApaG protein